MSEKRNFLVMAESWGDISDEQVIEFKSRIFYCGKCSSDEFEIYHNCLGTHNHIVKADFAEAVANIK